ncbi:MAG: restriction endonuclease subunit S [Mariprofundus sp.]
MSQELYELPEGWKWKTLADTCEMYQPKTISSKKMLPDGKYPVFGANGIIGSYDEYNHENVELLITCRGATCGTVNRSVPYAWINGNAMVVRPLEHNIDLYFLKYAFEGGIKTSDAITGSAQPQITRTSLNPLTFPLPPFNEQKRIVAKLDALFTRIDTALSHLQQTLKLSKALFASELDSTLVPTGSIEITPEKWSCETLQTVSNLVSDGTHHSPKEQFNDQQGGLYKYITSKNIKFDGLKLDSVTYIRKEVHDEIYARCNPEYLDQLITKDGAMTGTCCLNTLDEPFSLLSSVALVKLKWDIMLPHFLNYFLQSPTGQELMIGDISGAAITRTNLKKLKAIKVPLPPIKEQQQIVSHLNDLSERTRTLEASTQEKINDLTALKASLLNAAFKGQ